MRVVVRRMQRLTGVHDALNARKTCVVPIGTGWTFAGDGAAHAVANLCGIQIEFCQGAAEGVAMHAELFGGLALVSLVMREHLENIALLELLDCVGIGDSRAVHLGNDSVEFALQGHLTCKSIRV